MRNRLLFVTTHLPPDRHFGGVVESGYHIYNYLNDTYTNFITAVCVSKFPDSSSYTKGIVKICKSVWFHSWGFSVSLIFVLLKEVRNSDRVYINGVVTFPTTLAAIYCILLRRKYIIVLRGAIEPWRLKQKKLKKLIFYYFFVYPLLRRATYVHATSDYELSCLKLKGMTNGFVISNGVNWSEFNFSRRNLNHFKKKPFRFLFISRISKEKGVDLLISAYERFCLLVPLSSHEFFIVGPDNEDYLKSFNLSNIKKSITIIGGVYGEEKVDLYQSCHVLVLPSYSENFGNVIAEALSSGLPVITTNRTPWNEITERNCGFIIEPTIEALLNSMLKMFSMSSEKLFEMSQNSFNLVRSSYSWDSKCAELKGYIDKL